MGLFEHPFGLEGEKLKSVFYNKEDRNVSLQSALESMVLLKNNGVLPLDRSIKAVSYTHLDVYKRQKESC